VILIGKPYGNVVTSLGRPFVNVCDIVRKALRKIM
jgi:hypothetical protein